MEKSSRYLWPFKTRAAVILVPILFTGLLGLMALLRKLTGWPPAELDRIFLVAILVMSLLPILLAVIDAVAERHGVIEYRGLKLDFSRAAAVSPPSFSVPRNIGVPELAVTDTATSQILDALREATANEVVIVDLQDGNTWWETRLLVLIAGAVRLGRPAAVVFVGTEARISGRFVGWAPPASLLPFFLRADARYRESYARAGAVAHQWELVEPTVPLPPPGVPPAPPPWLQGPEAVAYFWMAFEANSGLPNPLAFPQFLQSDLGSRIEMTTGSRNISIIRLRELFLPVLRTNSFEEVGQPDMQLDALLSSDDAYVALTREGRYLRLLHQWTALTVILRSFIESK